MKSGRKLITNGVHRFNRGGVCIGRFSGLVFWVVLPDFLLFFFLLPRILESFILGVRLVRSNNGVFFLLPAVILPSLPHFFCFWIYRLAALGIAYSLPAIDLHARSAFLLFCYLFFLWRDVNLLLRGFSRLIGAGFKFILEPNLSCLCRARTRLFFLFPSTFFFFFFLFFLEKVEKTFRLEKKEDAPAPACGGTHQTKLVSTPSHF